MGPYDFKPYSRDGLGFDWPISYQDVAPYYDKVEMLIGVYGENHGLENTPETRRIVAGFVRTMRPRVVILPYTAGRHPDPRTTNPWWSGARRERSPVGGSGRRPLQAVRATQAARADGARWRGHHGLQHLRRRTAGLAPDVGGHRRAAQGHVHRGAVLRRDRERLIDNEGVDDPDANDWLAVNQFTVIEGSHNRRPDLVVFVNGLPLGLIELKNAADEDATVRLARRAKTTFREAREDGSPGSHWEEQEQGSDGEQLDRGEPGGDRDVGVHIEERPQRPHGHVVGDDVNEHVEDREEEVDAEDIGRHWPF